MNGRDVGFLKVYPILRQDQRQREVDHDQPLVAHAELGHAKIHFVRGHFANHACPSSFLLAPTAVRRHSRRHRHREIHRSAQLLYQTAEEQRQRPVLDRHER